MKKLIYVAVVFAAILSLLTCCASPAAENTREEDSGHVSDGHRSSERLISLSDSGVSLDGETVGDDGSNAVYISRDIVYYEDKTEYDSGNPYGEGGENERHTAEEAAENTVVNITEAGTYRISGTLSKGQILVDLGDDAANDNSAVVNLVLDGADISCSVAPAIVFKSVYECCENLSPESAVSEVDTSAAGAVITIAPDSVNAVNGSHVAKIYKDTDGQKKLVKQDGAIYSYMSMNIEGGETGTLNITADNEGLDTEMHLTINGGNINIMSNDDGINTNEDGVSVTTINGGHLHIIAGLGTEGDGIDSNGWLVINGGTVISSANPAADAGLDSDLGSYINGGTVVALGSTMDWAESESGQVTMNLQFAEYNDPNEAIVVTNENGEVIFAYAPSEDELLGVNARRYMGAIVSCPRFEVGATCGVHIGGTLDGEQTCGVYASAVSYSGGTRQSYTGTDVRDFGRVFVEKGDVRPEWELPEGFEGELPEPQDGFEVGRPNFMELPPPENPDSFGMEPPENPDGFGMEPPKKPDAAPDQKPPEDGEIPSPPEGRSEMPIGEKSTEFYMQDKVNFFSGVADA
ncbi:MAG: carbohydrate-binding domain-containing protein [Oscillospiraceae bacterium]|nr:carbohydrate-binding domain-containing protein [Oscillospiraceae bacterium]